MQFNLINELKTIKFLFKKFKNMRIIYLTNEENCCKIIVRIILLGGINKWQVKQLL